ncbi:MAG: hypothetical protein ACR2J9_07460 [Gaiellales bacterium]
MPRAIAVDWSGATTGERAKIWIAEAVDGELQTLESGRTRSEAITWVGERRAQVPSCVAGFDFSFSLPAWFLDAHGCASIDDAWTLVAEHGEAWLAACPAPFWGRPGRKRGDEPQLRACEQGWNVRGIVPKSVFQIGGAGAVGTGTLRGIPFLPTLRAAGWSIWPYDAPTEHVVAEIWTRLLTGSVAKSSADARRDWLRANTSLRGRLLRAAIDSEDAFDAAACALVLSRCEDLDATLRAPRTGDPREGSMLTPPSVLDR